MPSSCAAYNCVVRYKKGLDVKFHRFPKDEIMRNKWVIAIGRKDYKPSATAVICSNHFKAEDYYINNPFGTKVLNKEAIPSVFDFSKRLLKKENSRTLIRNATKVLPLANQRAVTNPNFLVSFFAEGSEKLYVEEQESIPSISKASQTSLHDQELMLSTSQASQTSIQVFHDFNPNVIRKRLVPVHVEDFKESDLESPRKRHKYWNISQSVIQKYRKNNKYLYYTLRKSNRKITYLYSLLSDLRKTSNFS